MRRLTATLFTSFTLVSLTSYADEEQQEVAPVIEATQDNSNVVVDSRPLSEKKKKLMEEKRRLEAQQVDEISEEEALELSSLIIPIKNEELDLASLIIPIKNSEEPELASLIIPIKKEEPELASLIIPIKGMEYASLVSNELNHTCVNGSTALYHQIDHFPQDNVVQTEDGAEWIFESSNNYILRTWRPGDVVVITPKGKWLWGSNYSYVMTNKQLGSSVDVNLFLGPIAFGSLSTWVVGIDMVNKQIYVLNGDGERSVWEISNVDEYLFKEWEVNDTLIVGENDSWLWWFSSYNNILINVNMNHHVRAKQISSSTNYHKATGRG